MLISKLSIQRIGCILLLAAFAMGAPCFGDEIAPQLLSRLQGVQSKDLKSTAQKMCVEHPQETSNLCLDLIVFRWMANRYKMPVDVKGIDQIVPTLALYLQDKTLSWAQNYYAVNLERRYPLTLPPDQDSRVEALKDLQEQVTAARSIKDSYPLESVNALNNAMELCKKIQLPLSMAIIQKQLGDQYLYDMAYYHQAESSYDSASWAFSAFGCVALSSILYDDWGTLSSAMGRYSDATSHFSQSARGWQSIAERDPKGVKYRDTAGKEYMRAGEAARAAGKADDALKLMNTHGLAQIRIWAYASKNYGLLIKSLMEVAAYQLERKETVRALELLREAQKAAEHQSDYILRAKVHSQMAKTYGLAGQLSKAAESLSSSETALSRAIVLGDEAIRKLSKSGAYPAATIDRLLSDATGGAYARETRNDFDQARAIWKRLADYYDAAGNWDMKVQSLRAISDVWISQGNTKSAMEALETARDFAKTSGKPALALEFSQSIAQMYSEAGQNKEAIAEYANLLSLAETLGNAQTLAKSRVGRGMLLAKEKDYAGAIADIQYARMKYLLQVGDVWASLSASLTLSDVQKMAGKDADRLATLESAMDTAESNYDVNSKVDLERNRTMVNLYMRLIDAYLRLPGGTSPKAWETVQRASRYPVWYFQFMDEMKRSPEAAVAAFAQSITSDINIESVPQINKPVNKTILAADWNKYVQVCWDLAGRYQTAYDALPIDPLDFFTRRNDLPIDALVIEYMPTESSTWVFIGGYQKSAIVQLDVAQVSIDEAISKLRRAIRGCEDSVTAGIPVPPVSNWQESSFLEIKGPLKSLYLGMVEPIIDRLTGVRRLVFCLPSRLTGIPIHALITQDNSAQPKFMIDDFEISYLGRGMLGSLVDGKDQAILPTKDTLAIFADPEKNLPGAQKEALVVRDAYINSRVYMGSNATRANFLSEFGQAQILHLATHHQVDPNPGIFDIKLAKDETSDGKMGIGDLLSVLPRRLELVTLSACDSVSSSDPLSSGTARAAEVFTMMGARSILGGLWKVSDEASSEIMGEFYRSLNKGGSRSESIRRAQLAVIQSNRYAHPFYWACLALFGSSM